MNKLQEIKDLIEDLKDCLDGTGVPNIHYISNKLMDLDKVVNTINYIRCCMGEAEQLLCSCDNPNGFKEMEEGRETCSKCKKPY